MILISILRNVKRFILIRMNQHISLFLLFALLVFPPVLNGKTRLPQPQQEKTGTFKKLTAPNPSAEANALFKYLQDMFGEKILSGQMWTPSGIDELEYVGNITGKQPAIRGIDLIEEKYNKLEIQHAMEWWKAGGIPAMMWHWGAPTKGEGFENSKMIIDTKQCLVDGTRENKAFWEELKLKADHLEMLRDANVPVLWSPFHEPNGNTFWWGKQGPLVFKQLWITMYNYFVQERQLNNLIWVLAYNSQPDEKWYPGNQFVDIVGAGTFEGTTNPQLEMFNQALKIKGSTSAPVVYSECGHIPDPELCIEKEAMWSWWMEWHTTHLTEMDKQYLSYVYNNDRVITLDEVPKILEEYGKNEILRKFSAGRIIPFSELKGYNLGGKSNAGDITGNGANILITGNGTDFGGTKDEGYFAFTQMEGDFDISIQVLSLSLTNSYAKAGIMARIDLTKGSEQVFFHVFPNNSPRNKNFGGCEFQFRDKKTGETKSIYPDLNVADSKFNVDFPNTWIRLTRKGNIFRSYISSDNKTWHLYSRHKQKMPEKLLVGLAITSRNPNVPAKAELSGLQLTW